MDKAKLRKDYKTARGHLASVSAQLWMYCGHCCEKAKERECRDLEFSREELREAFISLERLAGELGWDWGAGEWKDDASSDE